MKGREEARIRIVERNEGIERGVPLVRRPRARALTDQMYVLQPDNGPSRTSSGSPAALLDLVEAIVSRAFSLGPLPPYYVRCPHMATYRASKTEKKKKKKESIGIQNNEEIAVHNSCASPRIDALPIYLLSLSLLSSCISIEIKFSIVFFCKSFTIEM